MNPLYKALAMGAIAGMRSLSAPALLSHVLKEDKSGALAQTPLAFLQNEYVANTLTGLAATELVGDKTPAAPDRTELPSLLFRAASGALVGAAIYAINRKRLSEGAAVGAVSAVASTYASFYLRKSLDQHTGIADPVIGALEDALVLISGLQAAKS